MHRASYWKTTGVSIAGAVAASMLLGFETSVGGTGFLSASTGAALAALALTFIVVAAGGIVCLWRDAREAARKPDLFAIFANAPPRPSWLSRFGLRWLLGPAARPGDLVRVKTLQEVRATLDPSGGLDGMPFMVEMEEYCGKTFRVHRRVDKIYDMRHKTGLRRLVGSVSLSEVRCSGVHHGGCQAECHIIWRDAWLERLPASAGGKPEPKSSAPSVRADETESGQSYVCQMTRLWEASHPMSPFDVRQDIRPLLLGNIGFRAYVIAMLTRAFNTAQALRRGAAYPNMPQGPTVEGGGVPDASFRAGHRVVVRSKHEIARTLRKSRNRGLWFDQEMIKFCGQPAVVRKRVDRVINEATGRMAVMRTPCVMLEGVVATGEFMRLCPQQEYPFWREAWLADAEPRANPALSN